MAITETRSLPAQFIEDLGKDYAKQLTATTAIPVDTSKFAPTVAGQDPLQQRAAALAGSGVGSFEPFIQAAQQQATAAGQTVGDVGTTLSGIAGLTGAPTSAQIQQYMSPYQSQVIDTTLSEFDRQRAIQEKNIADQAIASGAFGGGREGVQRAEYQSQSDRDRAALQAQSQAELDAQRQAARTAAYEPLERLGFFGQGVTGLMGGYPAQYQFQSTPAASPLQTALGLGTGLAGIFGALK